MATPIPHGLPAMAALRLRAGRAHAPAALALCLWAALALVLLPAAALAHSSLIASHPPDGAVLAAPPVAVTLDFDAPVRPLVARLTGPGGETRMLPGGTAEGRAVRWPLPPMADEGSYLLSWRVTAEDGHPVAGATVFSLGRATAVAGEAAQSPAATRAGVWLSRAVVVGALLLSAGGAAFAAFADVPARRWAAMAGLIALPVATGFQGLDLLGLGPAALTGPAPWGAAAQGAPGAALGLAAVALLLSLGRGGGFAGLALAAAAGAAAISGHAATAPPQAVMRPAVALHVTAAALWIGALPPLAASLRRGEGWALDRFSAAAPWGMALLLATGSLLAVVQVGRPAALLTTDYGRVLMAKLTLVALMLVLAATNRFRLGAPARRAALRRSIAAEIALSVLVIATLALWRFTPPPRTIPAPVADARADLAAGGLSARVTVAPGRAGPVSVRVEDLRLDGAALRPLAMTVEFSKPAYGLGPFSREVGPGGGTVPFLLPLDGYWVVRLRVVVSDFRSEELRDIVEIAPAR